MDANYQKRPMNEWIFDDYSAALLDSNMSLTFRAFIAKTKATLTIRQMSVNSETRLFLNINGHNAARLFNYKVLIVEITFLSGWTFIRKTNPSALKMAAFFDLQPMFEALRIAFASALKT